MFVCVYVLAFGGGGGAVLAGRMGREYGGQRRHGSIYEYLSPKSLLNDHVLVKIPYYIIQAATILGTEIFYIYSCVKRKKTDMSDGT